MNENVQNFLQSLDKSGMTLDVKRHPIIDVKEINAYNRTYYAVAWRHNSSRKGVYIYSLWVREKGSCTGGWQKDFLSEEEVIKEFNKTDASKV